MLLEKIVIAFDSFKGSLTSTQAAEAAAKGIREALPQCQVVCLPVSDGGEGILDALLQAIGGQYISCPAHDPLMHPLTVPYGISADKQTAIIEMAAASGLTLVSPQERNPLHTTTYGTGEQIRHALSQGCRHVLLGLGGSATNDAGLGMLQALGYVFKDKNGQEIGPMQGEWLEKIASIDTSNVPQEVREAQFTAACDVNNPFLGLSGAAHVFAPQKGAGPADVAKLEKGMSHIAELIRQSTGTDISAMPGAGAAGGMGGALAAFLHASLKPGIQLLLNTLHFAEMIQDASLIITGEGKADRQTLMGKVPAGILHEALQQEIPVWLLAGAVDDKPMLLEAGFQDVYCINPPGTPEVQAMNPDFAQHQIKETVKTALQQCLTSDTNIC